MMILLLISFLRLMTGARLGQKPDARKFIEQFDERATVNAALFVSKARHHHGVADQLALFAPGNIL